MGVQGAAAGRARRRRSPRARVAARSADALLPGAHARSACSFNHFTIDRRVDAFYQRLDDALAPPTPPLADRRPDELVAPLSRAARPAAAALGRAARQRFLRDDLLRRAAQALTRVVRRSDGTLQNDLISGEAGMVSAEPAVRLQRLARLAARRSGPGRACSTAAPSARSWRHSTPRRSFAREYRGVSRQVRRAHGQRAEARKRDASRRSVCRCSAPSARSRRNCAQRRSAGLPGLRRPIGLRVAARDTGDAPLACRPLRRLVFNWVLSHARAGCAIARTCGSSARGCSAACGASFSSSAAGCTRSTCSTTRATSSTSKSTRCWRSSTARSTCTNLRALAALRKAEFDEIPGDAAHRTTASKPAASSTRATTSGSRGRWRPPAGGDERRGLGCCPGVVRGRVRVVTDPRDGRLERTRRSSSPSTPIPAGSWCSRPRWACWSSAAACCRTRRSSRASWASRRSCRSRASRAGCRTATGSRSTAAPASFAESTSRPRRRPRVVRSAVGQRADFSDIRYAQVWEDADVLLGGLDVQPGDVCVSIASAGDNALALLTKQPARVIALDLSPAQLACLELRVAAYRVAHAPRAAGADRLAALGAARRALSRCRPALGPGARAFWDARPVDIAERHRQRRQVRAVLRAVPPARAAARPPADDGAELLRAGDGPRAPALLRRRVGHLALAAAVPGVLLAHGHGPARARPRVLPLRRRGRSRRDPRSGRGTR